MSLIERDQQVIWHPFTPQKNMQAPIPITHGKGSLLFDDKGNTYIDAISSWWVNLHGHAHPYIAERLYQQALLIEQVIFAGFTHEPAVSLAERLLPILPGDFSKIFYSDNGSTSTEVALKMSIQYWWNQQTTSRITDEKSAISNPLQAARNKILAFTNSYHGDTFGAMSVSDRSIFTLAFQDLLFDVIFIDTPTKENISELKAIIDQHAPEIAAFIYEPLVQGAGGIRMYDPVLLDELLHIVKQHEIICIADEVMTGFGRTGKLFSSEYMNNKPDIICLSKGLTGGTMALGITACVDRIYQAYVNDDKLKTFFHGHSFTANPLACTAALASLDLLQKEDCLKKIEWISGMNKEFSNKLAIYTSGSTKQQGNNTLFTIKNIRCLGTLLAFEIDKGKDEYLNDISHEITQFCLSKGVYIRPLGNTMYIMPPYCITEAELKKIYQVIESVLSLTK
jgi:adenosylmethionine-8-amino-7-oxononanoate aminotransferase